MPMRTVQQLWAELNGMQSQQNEAMRLYNQGGDDAQAHLDEATRLEGAISQLQGIIQERTEADEEIRAMQRVPEPQRRTFGEAILGTREEFDARYADGLPIGFRNDGPTTVHLPSPTEIDLALPEAPEGLLLNTFAGTLPEVPASGPVQYMQRKANTGSTATWGGVTDGESATKARLLFDWEEKTANIETIAGYVPISKPTLRDYASLMSIIQHDLLLDLNENTDSKYLNGSNSGGIVGILNTPGIQEVTDGYGGQYFDAIRKMRTKAYASRRIPTRICLHPTVKEAIDLYKTTTNLYQSLGEGTYWGMQAVEDFNCNGILVYDPNAAKRRSIQGTTVEVGYVNDQFIKNELCILAEHTKGLQVTIPDAFVWCSKANLDKAAS